MLPPVVEAARAREGRAGVTAAASINTNHVICSAVANASGVLFCGFFLEKDFILMQSGACHVVKVREKGRCRGRRWHNRHRCGVIRTEVVVVALRGDWEVED